MEIKAGCTYDYETCKAVSLVVSYKKSNPKKVTVLRMILSVALASLAYFCFIKGYMDTLVFTVAVFVCALIVALELVSHFLLPRLQYRSMSKMKNIGNSYIFRQEDFVAVTEDDNYSADSVMKYAFLEKVMETEKYIFMYINKRQILVVSKTGLTDEEKQKLRSTISQFLGKKYIVCKY